MVTMINAVTRSCATWKEKHTAGGKEEHNPGRSIPESDRGCSSQYYLLSAGGFTPFTRPASLNTKLEHTRSSCVREGEMEWRRKGGDDGGGWYVPPSSKTAHRGTTTGCCCFCWFLVRVSSSRSQHPTHSLPRSSTTRRLLGSGSGIFGSLHSMHQLGEGGLRFSADTTQNTRRCGTVYVRG